jgi:hypothetical protein
LLYNNANFVNKGELIAMPQHLLKSRGNKDILPVQTRINDFRFVLSADVIAKKSLITMWNSFEVLRNFYSGKLILSERITMEELKKDFELALSSKDWYDIAIKMWVGNSKFQAWYMGKKAKIIISENPRKKESQKITYTQVKKNFLKILSSDITKIITDMWEGNKKIRHYFSGEIINMGSTRNPNLHRINFEELTVAICTTRKAFIFHELWSGSPGFQSWCQGNEVSITLNGQTVLQTLPEDKLIAIFKSALACYHKQSAELMWEKNQFLCHWYFGESRESETINPRITFHDLFMDFRYALFLNCKQMVFEIWEHSSNLKAHYSNNNLELDILISDFEYSLTRNFKDVSNYIWNNNTKIQAWYNGKSVKSDEAIITSKELLTAFKAVLTNGNDYLANCFASDNDFLKSKLAALPLQKKSLIMSILNEWLKTYNPKKRIRENDELTSDSTKKIMVSLNVFANSSNHSALSSEIDSSQEPKLFDLASGETSSAPPLNAQIELPSPFFTFLPSTQNIIECTIDEYQSFSLNY